MADILKNRAKKPQTKQIRAKKKELKKRLAKCLKVLDIQDSRQSEEIEKLEDIYEEEVFLRLYCTTQNRKHSTEGRLCLTEDSCSICLEPIKPHHKKNVKLVCGHKFHFKCIRDCFKNVNKKCPNCRQNARIGFVNKVQSLL